MIEWAERLETGNSLSLPKGKLLRVKIEIVNESERKICYDDFGA